MATPSEPIPPLRLNGLVYGVLLAVTTLAALILVAHHPVADMHDPAAALGNLAAVGGASRMVHGALIAMTVLFCVGMSGFAWRLGIEHPAVMAGWLSYLAGTVFLIFAALIDGFVVPDFAARLAGDAAAHPSGLDIIKLCFTLNQAVARLGFVLTAAGIVMWGHALLHHRGVARVIAILALATGGVSAVFLLTSPHGIDVRTLFWFMVGQVVWNLTVAFWLVLGLKRPPTSPV